MIFPAYGEDSHPIHAAIYVNISTEHKIDISNINVMHFVWEDVRCELLLKSMCHKVASLHCLHSRMTHHITLHTSYLYFLIPTLNLSNKFEMMRVDWESLKVSSCTKHSTPRIISSAKQLRSGQGNYTKTLFTLCTKIFTSVLDKIFSH